MQNAIQFISGLPRSGSTLLAVLLRQNPRFTAGMTMLRETSQRNETAVFVDDDMRMRLLGAVFDAAYPDMSADQVVFDTNRHWTTKLPARTTLFPDARMICRVRNPAWVMNSLESLVRRNAFELSGIFSFEPGGTVDSRIEALGGTAGMVGYAFNALREAVYGEHADRLLLVRYESLTTNPLGTLAAVYNFLGEPLYSHDPGHIEPCYDMIEFDARMGTPGLHHVGAAVQAQTRSTVLPPDLFTRYDRDAFWNDPAQLPTNVRLI